jgi:hypothetical protein
VGENGAVAIVLNLADGTSPPLAFSSALGRDGTCPFYTSLYEGQGAIFGWIYFNTDGSGTVTADTIWWLKAAIPGQYYPNGFANLVELSGGLYLPPKAGTNIFSATALTFVVDQGYSGFSLPDETDYALTFNPVKNVFTDTNKVTMNLTPSTGIFTGSFYPVGSAHSISYHCLEIGGAGYGFYENAGNKEIGPIFIYETYGPSQVSSHGSSGERKFAPVFSYPVSTVASPGTP